MAVLCELVIAHSTEHLQKFPPKMSPRVPSASTEKGWPDQPPATGNGKWEAWRESGVWIVTEGWIRGLLDHSLLNQFRKTPEVWLFQPWMLWSDRLSSRSLKSELEVNLEIRRHNLNQRNLESGKAGAELGVIRYSLQCCSGFLPSVMCVHSQSENFWFGNSRDNNHCTWEPCDLQESAWLC